MPYACIFENCRTLDTNELFESSEEWMAHLTNAHSETVWACSLCPEGSDGNDEVLLDSNGAWQNHIRNAHPDTFPEHQLDQLASMSERVSLPPMACPFCRHYDDIKAQPYDHIASHLHEFALKALPWSDNPNDRGYPDPVASVRAEDGRRVRSRRIIVNDDFDSSKDDQPPMSRSDTMKQLLKQIAEEAATILRLEVPEVAKGYQGVLEQLPILLDRARTLGLNSESKGQHSHNKSADRPVMTSTNREEEWKDRLDGYIRPLLRIQGIIHTFAHRMVRLSEREAKELEESLQDECAALRQLLDIDNLAIQTGSSFSRTSRWVAQDVSEIQRMIELVVEKREVPLHESHPFFEEAFQAQIEFLTAEENLKGNLHFGHSVRCKVEEVERLFSEVLADWENRRATQRDTANIELHFRKEFARMSVLAARPSCLFALLPVPDLVQSVCGGMLMVATCICTQQSSDPFIYRSFDALMILSSVVTTPVFGLNMDQPRCKSEESSREVAALCSSIFRLLTAVIEKVQLNRSCKFQPTFRRAFKGVSKIARSPTNAGLLKFSLWLNSTHPGHYHSF